MPDTGGPEGQWMDLADAITLLREQIAEAQRRINAPGSTPGGGSGVADKGVLFRLEEITLDLGLELTGTEGVNGGLRWSVLSFGGKKESGTRGTHTLTVKLTPHRPDGGDVDVNDEE
ncbi:trypco2 family protein [Streptomyces sp. B1866]|uniref:trypco2 family protein n=1 Tax=Streptomyces sp. B1866 TaxID=3075431 RepID=UPI0028900B2C|nr:trypco2 family protein [Streptomyces sp. B1866]MDT3395349.1 trypco2 family protein [Streptomyces sp. B1866]